MITSVCERCGVDHGSESEAAQVHAAMAGVRKYLRDKYWDDPNKINGPEKKHKRNFRADRPWDMPMSKTKEPVPSAETADGVESIQESVCK